MMSKGMRHTSIEGIYRGGKIELSETPAGVDEARVIVTFLADEPSAPPWPQALAELATLPDNWDGYGSPGLQAAAVKAAFQLLAAVEKEGLPAPHLCPVTGGGVGLAWQVGSRELEVEILPDGTMGYLTVEGEDMHEGPLSLADVEQVKWLTSWLSRG